MKKIISFFSALSLIIVSTITVIACAPTPEKDVIFILSENTTRQTNRVRYGYENIINDFNQTLDEQNSDLPRIKLRWEFGNSVQRHIDAGENLPDLYVGYIDDVVNFANNPTLRQAPRDMEASITLSEEQTSEFKNQFWDESFYNEGIINDKLYVLPANKSFDFTMLNKKVFLELIYHLDKNLYDKLENILYVDYLGEDNRTHLFKESEYTSNDERWVNASNDLIETLSNVNDLNGIRKFFIKNDNIVNLATIYRFLYVEHRMDDEYLKANYLGRDGDVKKMYALGLDSIDSRFLTEYADYYNKTSIDVESSESKNFLYNIENWKPELGELDLWLDNGKTPDSPYQGIAKFFNSLRYLAPRTGNNRDERWSGVINHGDPDVAKISSGTYFVQGTMMLTSGTSAGSRDYIPDSNESGKNTGVEIDQYKRDKDVMILPTATTRANNANFFMFSRGIAGFKSNGNNAGQKEQTVTKFLNYLLEPKNQLRFTIQSGYIPPTRTALEMFQYYKTGQFNNLTNSWMIEEDKRPENWQNYEQIFNSLPNFENDPLNEVDTWISDFLSNYLLETNHLDIPRHIVAIKGNPMGSVIHQAIKNGLRNYIFEHPETYVMEDFMKDSNQLSTFIQQVRNGINGIYNNSYDRIKYRP